MEQEGTVMEVLGKTVRVSLPSLGYYLTAEIPKSHVEVVNSSSTGDYVDHYLLTIINITVKLTYRKNNSLWLLVRATFGHPVGLLHQHEKSGLPE